ncbi:MULTISPECIES: hypothetical protein [Rhodovulum]|uniref:Uncharacterized protein n=2 Tax=Rhodovulum TaxID=34008 RepID=A0A8E2VKA8_9RHOB|nr:MULTISPECIES: hypothetical protein [Rhodovulum]PTW50286.1 hypothetical protein C8N38_105245 [Rhodovulum kholense]RAP42582.1 hypothetical protein BYZ73_05220 [Rhodovulum viride]
MEILKDQFKWMLGLVALIGVFGLGYELNKADPSPKAGTEAEVAAVAAPAADTAAPAEAEAPAEAAPAPAEPLEAPAQ